MPQRRAQQPRSDFFAPILKSSAAQSVVKGGMAALAFQFIEPDLDPALPAEPNQPPDELVPVI